MMTTMTCIVAFSAAVACLCATRQGYQLVEMSVATVAAAAAATAARVAAMQCALGRRRGRGVVSPTSFEEAR
ncbi:hypothetical protein NPX13_g2597 [Xylaria arbuscula]|uniref:Secreted protein n=1 Tax=Xylaria arbuscula TaxID=114810 RepID=A0A9W8NJX0_9PEZI|nr:hypothetical protein NPX13_g2597 [Xylaria arbuscula]